MRAALISGLLIASGLTMFFGEQSVEYCQSFRRPLDISTRVERILSSVPLIGKPCFEIVWKAIGIN